MSYTYTVTEPLIVTDLTAFCFAHDIAPTAENAKRVLEWTYRAHCDIVWSNGAPRLEVFSLAKVSEHLGLPEAIRVFRAGLGKHVLSGTYTFTDENGIVATVTV